MFDFPASRRGILHAAVATVLAPLERCTRGPCTPPAPSGPLTPFRRGISIHWAYNWPEMSDDTSYVWPPFAKARQVLSDANLTGLKQTGLDFIRLTVNPRIFIAHLGLPRYHEVEAALLWGVHRLLDHGFNVIVDLHSIRRDPENRRDAFFGDAGVLDAAHVTALVQRLAVTLSQLPPRRVALELWNEPNVSRGKDSQWDAFQQSLHRALRAVAPHLTAVVAGINTSYEGLLRLDGCAYNDGNTYFSFHYYDPTPFTLQGMVASPSSVDPIQFFGQVPYPTSPQAARQAVADARLRLAVKTDIDARDRADIEKVLATRADYLAQRGNEGWIAETFDSVANWARDNKIAADHVMLGEFGAMRPEADTRSRLRWLYDVRRAAERAGFPWSLWQLESPVNMGLIADARDHFDQGMLTVLGLERR